ncbi:MAG: threonine synthase [Bacteroidetes bacterium]|nr:threonine synthase [Bacteroidota bacterium]
MKLVSTRDPNTQVSFVEATQKGLADDGGLFVPISLPTLPRSFVDSLPSLSFQEIAFAISRMVLAGEIPDAHLREITERALKFPAPLRYLDEDHAILELFHGPTLAFKDFGAQFMAQTMAYIDRNESRSRTILVATSGDTGSAVAHGFHGMQGMRVVLLYPSGKISSIQELQLTTIGGNVAAIEVDGTFDDCQSLVKAAFMDRDLSTRTRLTSANSINIARLLPQTFYYASAIAQVRDPARPVVFAVPSGNLGNLTAGLMAWKMGLPVEKFVGATNINQVLSRYVHTGRVESAQAQPTISNAMDVGNPSNLSRIRALFDDSLADLRQILASSSHTDDATRVAIKDLYRTYRYVMDPHGAVAYCGLREYRPRASAHALGIVLETAHPAKFLDVFDGTMRKAIEIPERLRRALKGKKSAVPLSPRPDALKEFLVSTYHQG